VTLAEPVNPDDRFAIIAGHLCVKTSEDCTCDGGGEWPHRMGCGYEPAIELDAIEQVVKQHAELLRFYQQVRVLMGYPALNSPGRSDMGVVEAEVELLARRFHGEPFEPGLTGYVSNGSQRTRRVEEELVMATLAAFRCIPDGEVRQGCTISDGAAVKRWLLHAGRAARQTLVANRKAADAGLAAVEREYGGSITAARDAAVRSLKEVADA
jgi:hypothetical protein